MKICNKCNNELDETLFSKDKTAKDGLNGYCKSCSNIRYNKNRDKVLQYDKDYRLKNPNYQKEYRKNNKSKIRKNYQDNKEDRIKYAKNYSKENPNYQKEYSSKRYKTDPLFKLKGLIRANIKHGFKSNNFSKPKKTEQILGCTFEYFKEYIEKQFEPWMNWENNGGHKIENPNTRWDLDHKIPISSAQSEEDVIKLNHYTNFQPLCSYYNRYIKRNYHEQN